MTSLCLLTDYKGHFGYKWEASPYRSGFDKALLSRALESHGVTPEFLPFADVDLRARSFAGCHVVYTSSEDADGHYKSFIEDVVLALQLQGANVIPRYESLRAHNNKVFMELLRDVRGTPSAKTLRSHGFGTADEFAAREGALGLPVVLKPAAGAMSTGVTLVRTKAERKRAARNLSRSYRTLLTARDLARTLRRPGYVRESWHRRKFVAQQFLPALDHDWKVLVYGAKLFAVRRGVRPGDFRASGSGVLEFRDIAPDSILNASVELARALDVPWLSVDAVEVDGIAHILEFQVLHFGTAAIQQAPGHFTHESAGWTFHRGNSIVEEEFARALAPFLKADRVRG